MKTGENTVRTIKAVLSAYGIDSEETHIIYLTDNGSNFVSGLQSEVHLRCICKWVRKRIEREMSSFNRKVSNYQIVSPLFAQRSLEYPSANECAR